MELPHCPSWIVKKIRECFVGGWWWLVGVGVARGRCTNENRGKYRLDRSDGGTKNGREDRQACMYMCYLSKYINVGARLDK